MKRAFIFILLGTLVLLPLALLAIRHPIVSTYLERALGIRKAGVSTTQYVAESKTPDKTLTLVDTGYLNYVAAKLGIFEKDAIVDRNVYRGNKTATKKYTVTQVKFVLIGDLDSYVYGLTGGKLFAAKGDYAVEGDTLRVSIALFPENVEDAKISESYALEQAFLKTAFVTLLYAHGISDPRTTATQLEKLRSDNEGVSGKRHVCLANPDR